MIIRYVIDKNKVIADNRLLLSIEGFPNRVSSMFEQEYFQAIKPGKEIKYLSLDKLSSYAKVSTTVYYPEYIIERFIKVLKEENFKYKQKMRNGIKRDVYWKRIAESTFNEVTLAIFEKVKKESE